VFERAAGARGCVCGEGWATAEAANGAAGQSQGAGNAPGLPQTPACPPDWPFGSATFAREGPVWFGLVWLVAWLVGCLLVGFVRASLGRPQLAQATAPSKPPLNQTNPPSLSLQTPQTRLHQPHLASGHIHAQVDPGHHHAVARLQDLIKRPDGIRAVDLGDDLDGGALVLVQQLADLRRVAVLVGVGLAGLGWLLPVGGAWASKGFGRLALLDTHCLYPQTRTLPLHQASLTPSCTPTPPPAARPPRCAQRAR